MGPDWLWVGMFAVGGAALGLLTALVGLRKGRDLWYWLGLFAAMMIVVLVLRVEHPLWTMLVGGVIAGVVGGLVQAGLLPWYRRNNPWFEMDRSPQRVAAGFVVFGLLVGAVFGIVLGAIAWGLSGLFA